MALPILALAIVIGLAIAYTDIGQLLREQVSSATTAEIAARHEAAAEQPLPSTSSPPTKSVEPQQQPAPSASGRVVRDQIATEQSADTSPPSVDAPPAADKLLLSVDVLSLQQQPGLFLQLVQLYRERLAKDPDDAEAQNALSQLQERIAQEKPAATATDDEKAPPPRPRIDSLSIVSGIMENEQFVPRNNGGVLMVSISYRNFSYPPADPGDDTLTMLIRAPGNPLLLAEVPVDIPGDRGTRNFRVETPIRENTSDHYQLDLVLRGRLLESRVVMRTYTGN